ncbi:hypothetical protein [Flavobacterium sp.]|uniref:hypothetical protein n=1 Tax=Flavobacterium sp. TaxID=239 RepID=UPI001205B1B0|nr:hypothetical protein [Flavobacterium sp.]RZJ73535.1 MAG: hypothetical protein EOO49_01600 [Flavobacterium sp.]
MNLEARKISFIQEFLRIQNEELITKLETFLQKGKADLANNEIRPMTNEQLHKDIEQSEDDFANGRFISATDLKAKIRKWS